MKIKICGITNYEDALLAEELGADYIGFIFYPPSKRFIEYDQAGIITAKLTKSKAVAVTVDLSLEEIKTIREKTNISIIQLHGAEDQKFIDTLTNLNFEVWKAFAVKNKEDLLKISSFNAAKYLIDSFSENARGGTGKTFAWDILNNERKLLSRSFIAGGINVSNLNKIMQYSPYGIDLSSGVEKSPGVKDHLLLKKLFRKINSFSV